MALWRGRDLGGMSVDQVSGSHSNDQVDVRSDLFRWMALHRVEFAAKRDQHTWAGWAEAFEKVGIKPRTSGAVLAKTVKQTWWRVRKYYDEPTGEPILDAEKAKVSRRRSPRKPSQPRPPVVLRPGEVAPGVRLVEVVKAPEPVKSAVEDPFAALRERMRER
jgi:hypothetical protein